MNEKIYEKPTSTIELKCEICGRRIQKIYGYEVNDFLSYARRNKKVICCGECAEELRGLMDEWLYALNEREGKLLEESVECLISRKEKTDG